MRIAIIITAILFFQSAYASPDAMLIVNNIEKNEHQSVQVGSVENLTIARGNAIFNFSGELTLFDFGSGRICAMVFEGQGNFNYIPPDDVELYQVQKFTDTTSISGVFNDAIFYFTAELERMPDTSLFQRRIVDKEIWEKLQESRQKHFDHLSINVTNQILGDLLCQGPGTYWGAAFKLNNKKDYIFIEDPFRDDIYALYHLYKEAGNAERDYVSGYSPDNSLPSQRGVVAIDINHYDFDSRIEGDGDMTVKCKIHFTPARWGRQFLYFGMYSDNKILYAVNSSGDTLDVVRQMKKGGVFTSKHSEYGFGLVLNKPLELGVADSIEIGYECESVQNYGGNYAIYGRTSWYPQNVIRDVATYKMIYNIPKSLDIVSCGSLTDSRIEDGRAITTWELKSPVNYVSFSFGSFETKEFVIDNYAPVKIYMSDNIPHQDWALFLAYFGELSSANMIGRVGADVTNSLIFYTSIFGPCPFDTIRAVEFYSIGEGQGSPGLIHLSWDTFQQDDLGGRDERFRAHEVAHQWWGHIVDNESYRDTWILEGLSEYCGFWFYQMSTKNTKACNGTLAFWEDMIISGDGLDVKGAESGPPVIGWRLASSKSSDYSNIVYRKGAYIFHMIRYLMHDYKTGSDDAFAAFLKDLAVKFKGKVITTQKFKKLLEEHVGGNMTWFFDQWVYGTATPEYLVKNGYNKTADGKFQLSCHIKQSGVPDNFQMVVPLTVFFSDDKYIHFTVLVDQPEIDVDLPLLPYEPKEIRFNTYDAVLCKVEYVK